MRVILESEPEMNSGRDELSRLLWFLLGGTRGGENRVKILNAIRSRPCNLNQLAKLIGIDYRSVQHHITVLQKNNLVFGTGKKYGVVYSIHPYLKYHYEIFEGICRELGYSDLINLLEPRLQRNLEFRRKADTGVTLQI